MSNPIASAPAETQPHASHSPQPQLSENRQPQLSENRQPQLSDNPLAHASDHPLGSNPGSVRARLQPCRTSPPKKAASAAGVRPAGPRTGLRKLTLQLVLLCVAAFTMLGASDPSTRFDHVGHKLMCTCGCGEILLECNHMGCPDAPGMIAELHNQLASGLSDTGVLNWFAARYGSIVLAAPIRGGFDLVAWIVPFAVLALGIGGVIFLLRFWKQRHAEATLPHTALGPPLTASSDLRDRIRRDTTFEP